MELRTALNNLPLHLKLDHGDGLVHLRRQPRIHGVIDILIQNLGQKPGTGIILINPGREHGQGAQVNPVAVLQKIEAVVADRDPQHVADAGQIAGGRSHPGNIMISPLDIYIVELHQLVHNKIRPGAPVENISDDMEIIDGQVLDQVAERLNKLRSHSDLDNGVDDLVVVNLFIFVIIVHMQKLVNNIGEVRRHLFTHLGPGIFGGRFLADPDQPVDHHLLPVLV